MSDTLPVFLRKVRTFADEAPRRAVAAALQQVVPVAGDKLRSKTPVDTGMAQRGWGILIGGRPGTVADLATLRDFTVVSWENTVPYIEKLESGSSQQAPNGMLKLTAGEMRAEYDFLR